MTNDVLFLCRTLETVTLQMADSKVQKTSKEGLLTEDRKDDKVLFKASRQVIEVE